MPDSSSDPKMNTQLRRGNENGKFFAAVRLSQNKVSSPQDSERGGVPKSMCEMRLFGMDKLNTIEEPWTMAAKTR